MTMNVKKLKGWDTRVKEAQRDPIALELPLPADEVAPGTETDPGSTTFTVTVLPLLGKDVRALQAAQREGDEEAQLRVIFKDDADRVLKVMDEAPFAAGQDLIQDILVEFGVLSGNR